MYIRMNEGNYNQKKEKRIEQEIIQSRKKEKYKELVINKKRKLKTVKKE